MGWKGKKVLGQSGDGANDGIILPSVLLCIIITFRIWEPCKCL